MRTFNERLANDELVRLFAFGRIMHPMLIEMFGLAGGYEGFWIDAEHSQVSGEQLTVAAVTGRANGFDCFVRIPPVGYWMVTQCLEAGAGGVMAAQIHTVDQAREFVSWCKFAPQGTRGLNAGGRDANYSHTPPQEFIQRANDTNFVAIQIETLGSVTDADAIAALPGVDLLFVGPADLSLALGVCGEFQHPKLWEAISTVADACKKHGKHWGCVAPTPAFADRAIELGCKMPTMGNEVNVLRRGIGKVQSEFANQFSN